MAEKYIKFREITSTDAPTSVPATFFIKPNSKDLYFEGTQFACLENNVRTYVNDKFAENIKSKLTISTSSITPASGSTWTTGAAVSTTVKFYVQFDSTNVTPTSITCTSGESVTVSSNLCTVTTSVAASATGKLLKTLTFNVTYNHSKYGAISKQFYISFNYYAPTYIFNTTVASGANITSTIVTSNSAISSAAGTFVVSNIKRSYPDISTKAKNYLWFAFPAFIVPSSPDTGLTWKAGGFEFPVEKFHTSTLTINGVNYYLVRKSDLPAIDNTISGLTIS